MDNLTPEGNLNMLDRSKYQASERHIKVVEADDVFESTAGFELMGCFISFHRPPVVGKPIITNVIELMKGEGVIFYNEPPALEHSDLVRQIHWRFRVLQHGLIKQKTRPGTLFYGKRGEYCCCKYRVFFNIHKIFLTLSCRVTRHTYSESVSRCPCMKSGKFLRGTMVEALRSALIVIKLYGLLYICRVWSIGQIHSQGPYQNPIQWRRSGSTLLHCIAPGKWSTWKPNSYGRVHSSIPACVHTDAARF